MAQSAEVFVSYSRDDERLVFDLAAKLREAGVSLWIDQGALDAASLWSEQIVNALESAKVLLLMVTESAVHSHNVT
ncbi:MAG TPA: toll/interleukin-1 receptor domain-containing protein, partial [Steroidobacteraceae bacterium]|nr:toll/interleukin-1 receptor domain-containing protein [Steroidobacteraceae bacterium]